MIHECGCATFGPGPHPVDARHPNVRGCEHAEGLDVEKAANDVRHGGHHLDSYWEGFNDGVDALEARLRAASRPSESGLAQEKGT